MEQVTVHFGDSARTPLAGRTTATRQLYMSGNAVLSTAWQLREQLISLSPDEQVALLAPLRDQRRNDVWRLVEPVLRELDLSTELTPAAPHVGGGKEPLPLMRAGTDGAPPPDNAH